MLHELLTVEKNRINVSNKQSDSQNFTEFIVSSHIDTFFENNMF